MNVRMLYVKFNQQYIELIMYGFVQSVHQGLVSKDEKNDGSISSKLVNIFHQVLEELLAPPTLGSVSFINRLYHDIYISTYYGHIFLQHLLI